MTDPDTYDVEWQRAMGAGDVAALRKLLRPDAVVVHHDGRFETGRAYLDRNEQGAGARIVEFAITPLATLRFDDTVVTTGRLDAVALREGARHPLAGSVTRTWVRDGAGWKLAALATSGH